MCKEYEEFWKGRTVYHSCDFCGEDKESRGLGWVEVDVLSQCWDCYVETLPESLQAILFREVQEYLWKNQGVGLPGGVELHGTALVFPGGIQARD